MKLLLLISVLLYGCTKANSQDKSPDEQTLIGGTPADPKDWPASVYATTGNASCSATVVGEQVLLIASHCVANGGTERFSVGANAYTAVCSRSPKYMQGIDHDLAICKINKKVEGIAYEVVNLNPGLVKLGSDVLLTGYGCVRPGGGGGNDGVYRIGFAKVLGLPSGNEFDYHTRGKAALCFGDSGGSAYVYLDAAKTKRVMISVNSKGDIRDDSYITSTSTQASIDFLKEWAGANSLAICGVHADAKGCRGMEGPSPTPPPMPPTLVCKDMYKKLESCIKDDVVFL